MGASAPLGGECRVDMDQVWRGLGGLDFAPWADRVHSCWDSTTLLNIVNCVSRRFWLGAIQPFFNMKGRQFHARF